MPELSRFFGIIVTMYHNEHGVPHVHLRYGEHRATIEILSERVHGALPVRVRALGLDWMRLHRAELLENWQRAREGVPLHPISPLE
jgi:hypothetical protein